MKPIFTLLLSLFCLCIQRSTAQNILAEPVVTDPAIAELAAQVDSLKAKASTWDKIVAGLPRISGFVQTGYEWSENASTFFIKRVRLSFSGDITPKFDYRVQLELVSPRIVDAYVRYRPFTALNVQVGEFKLPFSIENTEYSPPYCELIEQPLAVRRLVGVDDASGRDIGAMLSGGFIHREGYSIINYDLGVFNGEGINTIDLNKSKDIVARLELRPVRGLLISGSYHWGEYGKNYLKYVRYAAGASYDRGAVVVRSEYIGGTTGELDSGGWYALAGWRVTRSLMPVMRYDMFREDTALSASRQTNYTVGLQWVPLKHLRCQLNYTYEDYADDEIADCNVVAVMVSGVF